MTNSYPTTSSMTNGAHSLANNDCQMKDGFCQLPSNGLRLPNALSEWPEIRERLGDRPVAIFLDYDGTLSPHVPDPNKATISDEMRQVLVDLSQKFQVSIITGRNMDTIRRFLKGIDHLFFAASHGLDITFDAQDSEREILAEDYIPDLLAAYDELKATIGHIEGSLIENNRLSVSVHYRNVVDKSHQEEIQAAVEKVLEERESRLKLIAGEKVWELRPNADGDKGHAVEHILKKKFLPNHPNTIALYLGDDKTDEDAFKVIRRLQGITILVNQQEKDTNAEYRVATPSDVLKFLKNLLADISPACRD